MDPVGTRTSRELTSVRTVLSRAETALEELAHVRRYGQATDPDHGDMVTELEAVVALLSPYRRTGRPKRNR